MNSTYNFKKQQNRDKAFAFQRKFKGLEKKTIQFANKADKSIPNTAGGFGNKITQLVDKSEKKFPNIYIWLGIAYVAVLILIYTYINY